jgi:transposase
MRMPRVLHAVEPDARALAALKLHSRDRAALVVDKTRAQNRIHGMLLGVCPPFARMMRQDGLARPINLAILARYGGPAGIRRAGRMRVESFVATQPYYRNKGSEVGVRLFAAIDEQTIVLEGTEVAEKLIKRTAAGVLGLTLCIEDDARAIAAAAADIPETALLKSLPGVGEVFSVVIAAEVGDISRFRDAGHLAAYAGVAPSKRQSGSSSGRARKKRRYSRVLKNALCESAWIATQHDDSSRLYYDKKRGEGKNHAQAILALARHRADVIFAVLKGGTPYVPRAVAR